jgi:DNA-binding NarL/FixJ family response regulator
MRVTHGAGHDSRPTDNDATFHRGAVHEGQADMKVYVVEDSVPVRERLVDMINEIEGFVVVGQAATFNGAVNGIRQTGPDIAIFDIQLADGSGIDALAEVRRELPGIRSIVLTNYTTPQHEKASADAGAEYFLDKSADFEKIAGILLSMKAEHDQDRC